MKKQTGFIDHEVVLICAILAFGLLSAGGWVANIIKLIGMLDGGVTAMFIARIVGVFAPPVGAVLGYL